MIKPRVNADDALNAIRAGLDDAGLMKKFCLSAKGLQSLLNKLTALGLLDRAELDRRISPNEGSVIIDLEGVEENEDVENAVSVGDERTESVVIVSDNRNVIEFLEYILLMNDMRSSRYDSGPPGRKELEETHASVVVADLTASWMELAQFLDRIGSMDSPPLVIAVTEGTKRKIGVQAVEKGAYDFLSKPLDGGEFMCAVRRALEYRRLLQPSTDGLGPLTDHFDDRTDSNVNAKDFLKGIIDSSTQVSVVMTDLEQNVLFWSKGAERIFGYSAEEMLGNKITRLYPPDALSKDMVEKFRRVVETMTETAHGKMKQVAKDGRMLTVSLSISPMLSPDGGLMGIVGIGLDVTDDVDKDKEIFHLAGQVKNSHHAVISAHARLLESACVGPAGHVTRMPHYCRLLGGELAKRDGFRDALTPRYLENLARSCVLHDIGMLAVPIQSGRSMEFIERHPEIGAALLRQIMKETANDAVFSLAAEAAHYHHELWNGQGYPGGLKGDAIPLCARITAIADVYDTLVCAATDRSNGGSHDRACAKLIEGSGTHFDPDLIQAFMAVAQEFRQIPLLYPPS
ncbi:MAG: HD domain-containing phosphohydrolase [Pseudomonadota bacterium]